MKKSSQGLGTDLLLPGPSCPPFFRPTRLQYHNLPGAVRAIITRDVFRRGPPGTDSFLLSLPLLLSLLFSECKLLLHVQDSQEELFCDLLTLIIGSLLVDSKKNKSIKNSSQRHTAALTNVIHHVELQTYFPLFFFFPYVSLSLR